MAFNLTYFSVRAAVVAKLVILGISTLISFILAIRVVLVVKLVISHILSINISHLSIIYIFFKKIIFTTSLSLLKSTRKILIYQHQLSTLFFKLPKLFGTLFNLSISNLSTSDFKLVKSTFLANSDVSTSVAFLKSAFVA